MIQIAREIFTTSLDTMKNVLSLLEFKLKKDSDDFKYAKKQIMDYSYNSLLKLFKKLEEEKLIEKCPENCKLRQGYSPCKCGGSGFINLEIKKTK